MKKIYLIGLVVLFMAAFLLTGCQKRYNGEISNLNIDDFEKTGASFFVSKDAAYKDIVIDAVNLAIEELGDARIRELASYHNEILEGKNPTLSNEFPEFPNLDNYKDVLVVYSSVDGPPFSYQGANGAVCGVEIDILKFAAAKLGRKIETRICNFGSIFNNITSNTQEWRISGIGVANTEERRQRVAFCNPHWEMTLNIISKEQDSFHNISQLNGLKIAVYTGETGANYVNSKKRDNILSADTKVMEYATPQTAFEAFMTNKVDVVVCLDYVAEGLIKNK